MAEGRKEGRGEVAEGREEEEEAARAKPGAGRQKPCRVRGGSRRLRAQSRAAVTCHGLITQRAGLCPPHLGLGDVSQVRPSNRPSPAVAEEGCTCQMRLSARIKPNFSWISIGDIAVEEGRQGRR